MYAKVRSQLIRRYWRLERDGFIWRRGHLVIELEAFSDVITVRREARPDCRRCEGTGSLYEQVGTSYDQQPYYDYTGPCPRCPEPRLYMAVHGRAAAAVRIALLARPSEWRAAPEPAPAVWEDEPPF